MEIMPTLIQQSFLTLKDVTSGKLRDGNVLAVFITPVNIVKAKFMLFLWWRDGACSTTHSSGQDKIRGCRLCAKQTRPPHVCK